MLTSVPEMLCIHYWLEGEEKEEGDTDIAVSIPGDEVVSTLVRYAVIT